MFLLLTLELFCATHDLYMIRFRGELLSIWAKKRISAFTSSVWLFAHRLLSYAVVVVYVISGETLRVSPLYIAMSFMFIMAYNGIGCVFEGVRRFSEFHVASVRIQVRTRSIGCDYLVKILVYFDFAFVFFKKLCNTIISLLTGMVIH